MSRPYVHRRGLLTRALFGACLSLVGCAGREGARRGGRPWSLEAEGTTIGRDLGSAPRGTVIPATSLGVDLVEGNLKRDAAFSRARFEGAVRGGR
jgi:hypothetical protein